MLAGCSFSFSLLVHTDMESSLIDFLDASSVLQVNISPLSLKASAVQETRYRLLHVCSLYDEGVL